MELRKSREQRESTGAASGQATPRVMASAPSVVQHARLMDAAGTAWHAVKCGNLEVRACGSTCWPAAHLPLVPCHASSTGRVLMTSAPPVHVHNTLHASRPRPYR
jgi:hypothetical protein